MFICLTLSLSLAINMGAQNYPERPATLDEAIKYPDIKNNKSHDVIAKYQLEQAKLLSEKDNVSVLMTRDQEVIIVTIPADQLFDPNSLQLNDNANSILRHYTPFLRTPDFYRLALAMYHDDSGSEQYCKNITDNRLQSIYDWFAMNASITDVFTFSYGKADPILPNNSMQNRRLNRRLEIYIIPGTRMIEMAKNKQLR